MKDFEPLIGRWHGEGEIPVEPPLRLSEEVTIERLGEFVVFGTIGEPAELPDSIAIIGEGPPATPSRCTTSTREGSSGCS